MAVASTARTPLNVVDQLIFYLDRLPDPWSVHCEVRVPGRLDDARVAVAASEATRLHPLARARLAGFTRRDRRLFWEIADRVDSVPLTVVDCPDDEALCEARSRLLSRRVDLSAAPPFALLLAHGPEGDSLILNLNHVAGDGISSYRLMASIARAYVKADDPTPDLEPFALRDLREHIGRRSPAGGVRRERERPAGRPARVSIDGGRPGVAGFGFHLIRLERAQTAQLTARRNPPASTNDLLIASLAVAIRRFNDDRGVDPLHIAIATPVNLRPPDWPHEIVSNIFSSASVPVLAHQQSEVTRAQLAVAERTRVLKQRRQQGGIIDWPLGDGIWPVGILQLATRMLRGPTARSADTAVLSNLGRLPAQLDFGADAGTATELWFSPPGRMPLGLAVGAAIIDDEIFLTIRYCKAQFDASGAAAFAHTWREVLLDV